MAKRTGRSALSIIVAGATAGLITGCSTTISGEPTADPAQVQAYKDEVARRAAQESTTKACTDFRDGYIQINRAINDFVDAYNNENGYGGSTVGSKITTAIETIDRWVPIVTADLVPSVTDQVRAPIDTWKQSAVAVRDSMDKREDGSVVNERSQELNTAKDAALTACQPY